MTLFTIGYQGLDIDQFKTLLLEASIDTIVDIRELPLSRKKGFSKKALRSVLQEAGIDYLHKADLGCPRAIRNQYRENGCWEEYSKSFHKHLSNQTKAIEELSCLATESTCALLCFEADYRLCHRSLVADTVRARFGTPVEHLDFIRN